MGVTKVKDIESQSNEQDSSDNDVCKVGDDSKHEQKLSPAA
jgi:hypothetical protein